MNARPVLALPGCLTPGSHSGSELDGEPSQRHTAVATLEPQNATLCGSKVFTEVIKFQ